MNSVNKLNSDLSVNEEIKSIIRPLSITEYNQLEESIKQNGCQSPIIIWGSRNIILDGHNRFEICMKNNIKFQTIKLEFLNDDESKIWMIKNQFSRRNLSYYERASLALKLESFIKEEARQKQLSSLKQNPVYQNSDKREKKEKIHTDKRLAKISGVSHDTIARVRKIEEAVDEETKMKLIKNKVSINEVYNKIKKEENKKTIEKSKEDEESKKDVPTVSDESSLPSVEQDPSLPSVEQESALMSVEQEDSLSSMRMSKSFVFVSATEENLGNTFAKFIKARFKYAHCIVWDKEDKKSPIFFIVFCLEKPQIDKNHEFPVYRENSYNANNSPKYYNELVEQMRNSDESREQ